MKIHKIINTTGDISVPQSWQLYSNYTKIFRA